MSKCINAGSGLRIVVFFAALAGGCALFFTACEQIIEGGGAQSRTAQVDLIDLSAYVKPPVANDSPDMTPINNSHYTGTIAWRDAANMDFSGTFVNAADYSAVLSLSAKKGFTFSGLTGRAFIHTGSANVTTQVISANACVVTVAFTGTYDTYTVIFDGNGAGAGTMANQILVRDFRQDLAANGFTAPPHHTFAGWNSTEDGNGTAYAEGASVINLGVPPGAQVRLYAQWDIERSAVKALIGGKTGGETAANPAYVKVDTRLTVTNWDTILAAIHEVNKFIDLDLSDCSRSDGIFNPLFSTVAGKDKIAALTLPDAVTVVGGSAFSYLQGVFKNFTALKIVSGAAVTDIGRYAFANGTTLESVYFPNAVRIGIYAFENCIALAGVSFPNVTGVGASAFTGCTALGAVNFPSLVEIGESAFSNCAALTAAAFPAAIIIDANAFRDCTALISIDCPNVTEVYFAAFRNCRSLVNVNIPTMGFLCDSVFSNCTSLTVANFPEITGFASTAFQGCTALSSIDFQKVVNIPQNSFTNYANLSSVNLPAVTEIGDYAFEGCAALTSLSFPKLAKVGMAAFRDCSGLTSIDCPKLGEIVETVFQGCAALTSISLPEAASIDAGAFSDTALGSITFGAAPPRIYEQVLGGSPSARTITVHIPLGSEGVYDTAGYTAGQPCWGNGFRGGGWEMGVGYDDPQLINTNISLLFQTY